MHALHQTGRLRLQGAPAVWSSGILVLLRIVMGLVIFLAVGGLVAVVSVAFLVENPPWFGMIFGFISGLGMMAVLFFLIRLGMQRQEQFRETEREPVLLEPAGLTLRGIGPIPWRDFGPAVKRMVPAEKDSGYTLRAVMELTNSGMFNVNERTPPELRERISPVMGPMWNRHHRYIYVPGVEGLQQSDVIELINMAHRMFGYGGVRPPRPPQ